MTTFYWHIHHDILVEPLLEPIKNRIAYIKSEKPEDEIETRLRLMKTVKGELPKKLMDTWEAYAQAWVACDQALAACNQAWKVSDQVRKAYKQARAPYDQARKAYDQAHAAYKPQVEALHKIECPNCPWNGLTIFP